MNKEVIRKKIADQRLALSPSEVETHSEKVCSYLQQLDEFTEAKEIACYLPIKNEIDLTEFIFAALSLNKNVYLPVIQDHLITFHQYKKDDPLYKNKFGILEPHKDNKLIASFDLECAFIPLVAFDRHGHRLGQGGGFFDRAFHYFHHKRPRVKPHLIGVAYSFQRSEDIIDKHDWDVGLNAVVTEKGSFSFMQYPG